jgi:hypothetical protein
MLVPRLCALCTITGTSIRLVGTSIREGACMAYPMPTPLLRPLRRAFSVMARHGEID